MKKHFLLIALMFALSGIILPMDQFSDPNHERINLEEFLDKFTSPFFDEIAEKYYKEVISKCPWINQILQLNGKEVDITIKRTLLMGHIEQSSKQVIKRLLEVPPQGKNYEATFKEVIMEYPILEELFYKDDSQLAINQKTFIHNEVLGDLMQKSISQAN